MLGFSREKQEIFYRRRKLRARGVSSMGLVHLIHKIVDPNLTKTVEHQRKLHLASKKPKKSYDDKQYK
ncbi:hypothetical protein GOV13_01925 [Candidatus Pacearchaeota archaeon]|nr:hypothetical protein [Candidatus Pacearchaeota archaeon]